MANMQVTPKAPSADCLVYAIFDWPRALCGCAHRRPSEFQRPISTSNKAAYDALQATVAPIRITFHTGHKSQHPNPNFLATLSPHPSRFLWHSHTCAPRAFIFNSTFANHHCRSIPPARLLFNTPEYQTTLNAHLASLIDVSKLRYCILIDSPLVSPQFRLAYDLYTHLADTSIQQNKRVCKSCRKTCNLRTVHLLRILCTTRQGLRTRDQQTVSSLYTHRCAPRIRSPILKSSSTHAPAASTKPTTMYTLHTLPLQTRFSNQCSIMSGVSSGPTVLYQTTLRHTSSKRPTHHSSKSSNLQSETCNAQLLD